MFQKLTPNTGVHWNAVALHKSCSIQADLSGLVTRVLFQHVKQRVQQEEVAQQTMKLDEDWAIDKLYSLSDWKSRRLEKQEKINDE